MFDGPKAFPLTDEESVIRLSSTQLQGDAVGLNVLNRTAQHHRPSGIWFGLLVVRVEDDDVTHAEVRHAVVRRLGKAQSDMFDAPLALFVGRNQFQTVVDVARLPFLQQRVLPCGGKA